ncbi:MAG: amidohydrolase family protein [Victivallales bacterium]|nr:amidohydrolase family protein [Victivallales bacterium]
MDDLTILQHLRSNYRAIRAALPWLDAWQPDDVTPPFPDYNPPAPPAASGLRRYRPEEGSLEYAAALAADKAPLLVKATQVTLADLETVMRANPHTDFIYCTGDRKILYDFGQLMLFLQVHPNFHLCSANLCNETPCERVKRRGLLHKLVFGSMAPFWDEDVSMSPIILSNLTWEEKCAVAGNNLRRLLGQQPVLPPEVPRETLPPFITDAHAHLTRRAECLPFPILDAEWDWPQWRTLLDYLGTRTMFVTPNESIRWAEFASSTVAAPLCEQAGPRLAFFEVFDPRDVEASIRHCEESLPMESCIGIKIHPASHRAYASDPRYAEAFRLAAKYGKPIMSHTWEVSSYNPVQKYSCPHLFESHLKAFPQVRLVLGHAGGRPSTMPEVSYLCGRYPNVTVDLAGDYFHRGVIHTLAREIGTERILFASDINWIDPRCTLGMLLQSGLTDGALLDILVNNARRVYGR